jgi:hypothetical protein
MNTEKPKKKRRIATSFISVYSCLFKDIKDSSELVDSCGVGAHDSLSEHSYDDCLPPRHGYSASVRKLVVTSRLSSL